MHGNISDALERGHHIAARRAEVNRRTHNEPLGAPNFLDDFVQIVMDVALAGFRTFSAGVAGSNASPGEGNHFRLHALRRDNLGAFLHELHRVAVGLGTSTDQNSFWHDSNSPKICRTVYSRTVRAPRHYEKAGENGHYSFPICAYRGKSQGPKNRCLRQPAFEPFTQTT